MAMDSSRVYYNRKSPAADDTDCRDSLVDRAAIAPRGRSSVAGQSAYPTAVPTDVRLTGRIAWSEQQDREKRSHSSISQYCFVSSIASPSQSAYATRVASMGRVGGPSHAHDNKTPRYLKGKLAAGAGNGSPELQAG